MEGSNANKKKPQIEKKKKTQIKKKGKRKQERKTQRAWVLASRQV